MTQAEKSLRGELDDFFAGGPNPTPQVRAEGIARLEPFVSPATKAPHRIPPPEPGIYFDVPFDVYRQWDAQNWSALKHCGRSMESYKYHWENEDDEATDAQLNGQLFHAAVLEPGEVRKRFAMTPAVYPVVESVDDDWKATCKSDDGLLWTVGKGLGKARVTHDVTLTPGALDGSGQLAPVADGHAKIVGKKWNANARFCGHWAEAMAAKSMEVVSHADLTEAEAMASRLWSLPAVKEFLATAAVEVCIVWVDPTTKLICKARLDAWNKGGLIGDVKSLARKVDNDGMAWAIKQWAYDGQAAFYLMGLRAVLTLRGRPCGSTSFLFLGCEKEPPHSSLGWSLSNQEDGQPHAFIQRGNEMVHRYLNNVKYSREHNWWPAYHDLDPDSPPTGIDELIVPGWMDLNLAEEFA